MAREDDDERGGGLPKTSRAIRMVGHAAGGGHHQSAAVRRALRSPKNFDAWDEDADDDGGGDVTYEWQEYPKHIRLWPDDPKRFIQVNNRAEEDEAMEQFSVVRPADERKRLLAIADVMGLKVDGRWALDKIEGAITAAGGDIASDPTK